MLITVTFFVIEEVAMLSANIKIAYGKRIVVNDSSIEASIGNLVVIRGYSGCGKSSILKGLQLLNGFTDNYFIDDKPVNVEVVKNNIASVFQNPNFMEDLTIFDQISFLYQKKLDLLEKWSTKLHVNEYLNKYPNQLSGGQKIRVALLIGLLKNAPYLLLDEPTASLDEHTKKIVIQCLKEYVQLGHCIIVATHDPLIIDNADVVYEFMKQCLIKTKESRSSITSIKEVEDIKIKNYYFSRLLNRKKRFHRNSTLFLILSVFLMLFSIQYNNVIIEKQNDKFDSITSREVIVSKSSDGVVNNYDKGIDYSELISKDIIEEIKDLDQVEEVLPFVLFNSITSRREYSSDLYYDSNDTIMYLESNKNNILEDYNQSIYYECLKYEHDILYDFGEDGVYISNYLANQLSDDISSLKNEKITFDLIIPSYNITGSSYTMIDDIPIPITATSFTFERVTFDIAGVLKGEKMGTDLFTNNMIYLNDLLFNEFVSRNKKDEKVVTYVKENPENIFDIIKEKEPMEGYSKIVTETPWQPSVYNVICNEYSDVPDVSSILNEQGLNAFSDYHEISGLNNINKNNMNMIRVVAFACALIILIVNIGIKVNNLNDEKKYSQFLLEQLLSIKEVSIIKKKKYLYFFIRRLLQCIISIYFVMTVLYYATYFPLKMNFVSDLIIFIILLILEFIVPIMIEGRIENDKII